MSSYPGMAQQMPTMPAPNSLGWARLKESTLNTFVVLPAGLPGRTRYRQLPKNIFCPGGVIACSPNTEMIAETEASNCK